MYLKTILLNNNCDLSVLGLIYINNLYFYDDLVRIFKSVNNFIMKELPRNIKRDDILQGIRKIEEEGIPPQAHSSTYDLLYLSLIHI